MATSRYSRDRKMGAGSQLSTARGITTLRKALTAGTISVKRQLTVTSGDRLDTLAGAVYGDSRYWWVLAAASDVGWGLQVPPGTLINVVDLADALGAI
jgi:nucleoid-associated protein YgaU